ADEEPTDQKKYLEDICKSQCAKPMHDYGVKYFFTLDLQPLISTEIGLDNSYVFPTLLCPLKLCLYDVSLLCLLQECAKRVSGDESGSKHCTGQYFDYWTCVDKCVAPKLFAKLK
ncbi:Ubiquinol-cytochrome C reductase hinge domain - like 3, partial [Theobroma cacao]